MSGALTSRFLQMREEEDEEEEEVDIRDDISKEELNFVDEFITRFTMVTESSLNEHLDIIMLLKCIPNIVEKYQIRGI
jgi:hypothetical protein